MSDADILAMIERLTPVFRDVFDDDAVVITPATSADDIQGWDSLAHIRLVTSIERVLDVRFTAAEVAALENVGDLITLIFRKRGHG